MSKYDKGVSSVFTRVWFVISLKETIVIAVHSPCHARPSFRNTQCAIDVIARQHFSILYLRQILQYLV